MNWTTLQTYNNAPTRVFEILCNQLFENWCKQEYSNHILSFHVVNGDGGDGGVESYAELDNQSIIGLQAKWFPNSMTANQIGQIKNSIMTAMKVRPQITRYIVCVPRDLASQTAKSRDNERKRWEKMKADVLIKFPKLSIDLWDETHLITELQKETSVGIHKFWFHNSEISEETIKTLFLKSREGWLAKKYIPELNTYGQIDHHISCFLGDKLLREECGEVLTKLRILCRAFLNVTDEWIEVCGSEYPDLSVSFTTTKQQIESLIFEIDIILEWIQHETEFNLNIDTSIFEIDIRSLLNQIENSKEKFYYYFHFGEVSKILHQMECLDIRNTLKMIEQGNNRDSLLFLGGPGTGKTHGVAAQTEKLLEDGVHIPILLQSRDVPIHYTWKDILISALGISNNWSEDEIWQALSSIANRHRFQMFDSDDKIQIMPKIIIIVDGLDESSVYEKWLERIQETNVIVQRYPYIRFCFTARPHIIREEDHIARIIRINDMGDVPVFKLFPDYVKAYDITVENVGWIQYALITPLSLKLFCDIHKEQTIRYDTHASFSLASLLKEKIDILEREFCKSYPAASLSDQYVLRTIKIIAKIFHSVDRLERQKLIGSLSEKLHLEESDVKALIQFLEDYGMLWQYCEYGSGYLVENKYYYYLGIQGYFDYASALMLLDQFSSPEDIDFKQITNISENTLYTLSIIAAQDFDYLIVSNPSLNYWFKEELLYLALRHLSLQNAKRREEQILQMMYQGAQVLIGITNHVILPLSRVPQHPLGSALLDKFLNSFQHPAERDILWSVPAYLNGTIHDKWFHSEKIQIEDAEFELNYMDTALGCPAIYAWALSSVDNLQRKFCRDSLMRWARLVPNEFYKLFLHFSSVNDPQIRSDIFSILMSLLFEDQDQNLINQSAQWLLENILSNNRIQENYDISIRYYSCSIIQKAIEFGLVSREDMESFLPPYTPKDNYIRLNKNALAGTRMGGYRGIHYDLSRYVLIDHFFSLFSNYDEQSKEQYEKLLQCIAQEQPDYKGISMEQLILSAAYAYITQMGWDESFEDFDHVKKRPLGVDTAIYSRYSSATHGQQSAVMSICEKYVWQARNYIAGFFSDRLLYWDYVEAVRISDYGLLDDFIIPMQELNQIDPDNIPEDHPWHIPEKESVLFEEVYNTKNNVIDSILTSPDIDWEKWLFIHNHEKRYQVNSDKLMVLGGYSCFYSLGGIETCLFVSSILIAIEDVSQFLNELRNNSQLAQKISNPVDWNGWIETSCYITPKEVCWFPWKKRYNSRYIEEFPHLRIQSAVDNCCYNFPEYGDVYYSFPSAPIRRLLNIVSSDGYLFLDIEKQIQAEYCITGEKWRTSQDLLLVSKDELINKVKESGHEIIWILREYRLENQKAREKFGKFHAEKDICSLGLYENGKFTSIPIYLSKKSK